MTFKETEEGKEYTLVVVKRLSGFLVHECNGCLLQRVEGKLYPIRTSNKNCSVVGGRSCHGDWNSESEYSFTPPVGWGVTEWLE